MTRGKDDRAPTPQRLLLRRELLAHILDLLLEDSLPQPVHHGDRGVVEDDVLHALSQGQRLDQGGGGKWLETKMGLATKTIGNMVR